LDNRLKTAIDHFTEYYRGTRAKGCGQSL
jgi:hypothetical protein